MNLRIAGEDVHLELRPASWALVELVVIRLRSCEDALAKLAALERMTVYGDAAAAVVAGLEKIPDDSEYADTARQAAALLGRLGAREGLGDELVDLAEQRYRVGQRLERAALDAFFAHVIGWSRAVSMTPPNVEALFRVDPPALYEFVRRLLEAERIDQVALGNLSGASGWCSGGPNRQLQTASPASVSSAVRTESLCGVSALGSGPP